MIRCNKVYDCMCYTFLLCVYAQLWPWCCVQALPAALPACASPGSNLSKNQQVCWWPHPFWLPNQRAANVLLVLDCCVLPVLCCVVPCRSRSAAPRPARPPRCCCVVLTTCTWMRWTGHCMTPCVWSSGCWRAALWCQVRCSLCRSLMQTYHVLCAGRICSFQSKYRHPSLARSSLTYTEMVVPWEGSPP